MADYLNSYFHPKRVIDRINEMQAVLAPEIEEHIRRWRVMDNTKDTWESNVEVMRDFAARRPGYVREHIVDHFNLKGTVKVTLNTDPRKGYLRLNSVNIKETTPGIENPASWTGIYFAGIPLEITAVPLPGHRFAGWQETGEENPALAITPAGDVTLTSVFE